MHSVLFKVSTDPQKVIVPFENLYTDSEELLAKFGIDYIDPDRYNMSDDESKELIDSRLYYFETLGCAVNYEEKSFVMTAKAIDKYLDTIVKMCVNILSTEKSNTEKVLLVGEFFSPYLDNLYIDEYDCVITQRDLFLYTLKPDVKYYLSIPLDYHY